MLYLISIGIFEEKDMSLKALEAARNCKKLYLELYTDKIKISKQNLEKLIGKKIIEIERSELEENTGELLREAEEKDVGILVGGDALSATTHISLLLDAKKQGIPYKIIHGSSIFTAVAETGLQLYKFGKTTTLTEPVQKSSVETIENNRKADLHTLVLLDIGMDALKGLKLLKSNIKGKVVTACKLGSEKPLIKYGTVKKLLKIKKLKGEPAVIIVPGNLHFMEEEFLKFFE